MIPQFGGMTQGMQGGVFGRPAMMPKPMNMGRPQVMPGQGGFAINPGMAPPVMSGGAPAIGGFPAQGMQGGFLGRPVGPGGMMPNPPMQGFGAPDMGQDSGSYGGFLGSGPSMPMLPPQQQPMQQPVQYASRAGRMRNAARHQNALANPNPVVQGMSNGLTGGPFIGRAF